MHWHQPHHDLIRAPAHMITNRGGWKEDLRRRKTTTARILATLLAPDSGRASVQGHGVMTQAGAVRRRIALTG